jgi:thioredoxin 1
MITEVNDSNYETIVTNSKKPTIIQCSATWCKNCVPMTVVLNEISNEYTNTINIVKIDVDDNPLLTSKFQIKNLPTILFMKDDKIVDKQIGTTTKSKLIEKMNKII